MDRQRILIDTSILIDHLRREHIAATDVAHSLPLLTLNLSHFERVDELTLLNTASLR